jgi:hypothetical protein
MAALFITVKKWRQPKCLPSTVWVNKMWYIHRMEYFFGNQNEVLTWINLENRPLQKNADCMVPFL